MIKNSIVFEEEPESIDYGKVDKLPDKIDNIKVLKKDLLYSIEVYFLKKNRRITNIRSANNNALHKIIKKFDVDINFLINAIRRRRVACRNEKRYEQEEKKIRIVLDAKRDELHKLEKDFEKEILGFYNENCIAIMTKKWRVIKHIEYIQVKQKQDKRQQEMPNNLKEAIKRAADRGLHVVFGSLDYENLEQYLRCNKFLDYCSRRLFVYYIINNIFIRQLINYYR